MNQYAIICKNIHEKYFGLFLKISETTNAPSGNSLSYSGRSALHSLETTKIFALNVF